MRLTKMQIKETGVRFQDLAKAFGVSGAMVSKMPDLMPDQYQFQLMHGSKEAKAIRRKVLRHLKKQEIKNDN